MELFSSGSHYSFKLELDEKAQIILQHIDGALDEAGFRALIEEMDRCVAHLKDPADIRILVDGRNLLKTDGRTRSLSLRTFRERNVNRMAVWGCSTFIRVLMRFMSVAEGNGKIRAFATESEGREWLCS